MLKGAFAAGMNAFGGQAEQELAAQRKLISEQQLQLEELKTSVSNASTTAATAASVAEEANSKASNCQKQLDGFELKLGELNVQKAWSGQAPTVPIAHVSAPAGPASSAAANLPHVPLSERTVAVMGRLGWDSPKLVLEQRAKAVLSDAGISEEQYKGLFVLRDPGSTVEIHFHTAFELRKAQSAVGSLRRKFEECEKAVWFAPAKSEDERSTGRVLGKLKKGLADLEALKQDTRDIKQPGFLLCVKAGDDRMVSVSSTGDVKWTPAALERYDKDDLDMMTEWAKS